MKVSKENDYNYSHFRRSYLYNNPKCWQLNSILTSHKRLFFKTRRERLQIRVNKHAFPEIVAVPMRDA